MPKLKGLIFDLDGTLLDSAPDLRHAINSMLREQGRRDLTLEEVTAMTGDGMMPLVSRAFEKTGGAPEGWNSYACFQAFIKHYRDMKADPSQIYPQVVETLRLFAGHGIKLGICTNKQEAATIKILGELDMLNLFGFVAGGDTYQVHKPHPDHVKGVMEMLGVKQGECAMVGDGPNDVHAAHGAGIPCIVVTHGYSNDYEQLGGDALIGNMSELPDALSKLGLTL